MIAWTDERIDTLKAMWAERHSGAEIAAAIGYCGSRVAVIAKARRLKLGAHPNGNNPRRAAPPRIKPSKPSKHSGLLTRVAQGLPIKGRCTDASMVNDLPPDRSDFAVSLLDARDGDCRYPISPIGGQFMFCGAPAVSGCSWCQRHLGVVMRGQQPSAGETIRALAKAAS